MSHCLNCRAELPSGDLTCEQCGALLAGSRMVAEAPLQEEAAVAYGLLRGAGLHPLLAYIDEGGEARPIDPEANYVPGAGLMPPVTTPYAVFVPEEESEVAKRILEDAGRNRPEDDPEETSTPS
jgi:hypothetical protein